MIKNIKYLGYSAVPSDYECPDGELAASANMLVEDGALKPIMQPGVKFSVGHDMRLFLHKVGSATNYLAYKPDGSLMQWIASDHADTQATPHGKFPEPRDIQSFTPVGTIISVAAVGYILIVSTVNDLYYIRYNANRDAYIFLGSKIPHIDIDFALKLNLITSQSKPQGLQLADGSTDRPITGDDAWTPLVNLAYPPYSGPSLFVESRYAAIDADTHQSVVFAVVSTGEIPIDKAITFKQGVEYMFTWERNEGVKDLEDRLQLQIWGKRNGASRLDRITTHDYPYVEYPWGIALAPASANSWTLRMEDEWTDIVYIVKFRWNESDGDFPNIAGNLSIKKGIDNSDSDDTSDNDTPSLPAYIKYTADAYNAIMGVVNKFVNEQVTDKSRFIYPFFLRYAIQLYDGSYSQLSAPILMVPNDAYAPSIAFTDSTLQLYLAAFAADIRYKIENAVDENWRDLIIGVDIFASLPIWPYDQSQEFDANKTGFVFRSVASGRGLGCPYFDDNPCEIGDTSYQWRNIADYASRYINDYRMSGYVEVAPRSTSEIMDDVETTSNFYKISSLSFEDLNRSVGAFVDLKLDKGTIPTLAAREALRDDVLSYEGYKNCYLKEFNRRLHVCHSSVILPHPAIPQRCFGFFTDLADRYASIDAYVSLSTEDGAKLVRTHIPRNGHLSGGAWYFYPDSRASKATFVYSKGGQVIGSADIPLKRHSMLNGAYWLASSLTESIPIDFSATSDPFAGTAVDNSVAALSTIYVSEANCPFSFKASAAVAVGAQQVVALSNSARALSQGQFGQFPLYAFTSEGIWALSSNNVGTYSAVQPIVRDETIDIDSITQIDAAVLFASSRGIMMLSGSQTQCISESLNSDHPFNVLDLPHIDSLHKRFHTDNCIPTAAFSTFIANCRMLYDYPHQRIIIYNGNFTYAYVYSLKSKLWGMMHSDIIASVNSYPEALAIDRNSNVVDFSAESTDLATGLIITRPLKLDAPDILKTIDTVIQRGQFRRGHVQTVLYGSRDLFNWHLVWSSTDHYLRGFRGSPYKYFRIALVCNLDADESIYGATVQFTPRLIDQPR